uniref:Orn_DAP_Arg_deC domain-containing protein n=1 Tax=Caenorhabditis japonica TaxID=281687 RepID=A0A8R1EWX8_CAEJA
MDAKFITNDDFDNGVGFVYQTNDGVYGSFGCKQMDINPLCKPLDVLDEEDQQQLHFGTILGPSLDQTDVAQRIMRCRQLRVGEWLVWEQMGAFTIPVDSEHPVPPVYYYSGKESNSAVRKSGFPTNTRKFIAHAAETCAIPIH